MKRALLRGALLLGFVAGCDDKIAPPPPEPPVLAPLLMANPLPGNFTGVSLDVSVSAPGDDYELQYQLGAPPEPTSTTFRGAFKVHLVRSAELYVLVRDPEGRLWGPTVFQYRLAARPGQGHCSVAPLEKTFFKPTESIPLVVAYQLPSALSQVELVVDGVRSLVTTNPDVPNNSVPANVEPLAANGPHTIQCRVSAPGLGEWFSETLEPIIDGTFPVVNWESPGGSFDHENWNGIFTLSTTDTISGIASVSVCNQDTDACLPLQSAGGDSYIYATVVTSGTISQAALYAEVVDVVGNVSIAGPLVIDLGGFTEAPLPAPSAITFTVADTLDLPAALNRSVSPDIRHADGSPLTPFQSPDALSLAPGWNDFLFRDPSRTEWESFAVYRAGVSIELPSSNFNWLVYSSNSTVAALQSTRIDVFAGNPTAPSAYTRAWFDVPHLFFIENRNAGTDVWDQYDNLYTVATDEFSGAWQARSTPVAATAVLHALEAAPASITVPVSCNGVCAGSGKLVFERRATLFSYPASHVALPLITLPDVITISAQATDFCIWFWDDNVDGALGETEPRALGQCNAPIVSLDRSQGSFAYQPVAWTLAGVDYGRDVTGVEQFFAIGDSVTPLVTRPVLPVRDTSGLGKISALGDDTTERFINFRSDTLMHYQFWSAGDTTTFTYAGTPTPISFSHHLDIFTIDEMGASLPAVVALRQDTLTEKSTNLAGYADMGLWSSPMEAAVYAERDGYLSEWFSISSLAAPVTLRLRHRNVTGNVHGYVQDSMGQPVSNAAVVWQTPSLRAAAFSDPDGYYSVPASGGTGTLTVSARGFYERSTSYALDVTTTPVFQWVDFPAERGAFWPQGLRSQSPLEVTGPGVAALFLNDLYYAVETDGTQGNWLISTNGIARELHTSGALPSWPEDAGTGFVAPQSSATPYFSSSVRCGARFQNATGGALADSSCWAWWGSDTLQEYFFGRLDPVTGFPSTLGMEGFTTSAMWQGTPAPSQELIFEDQIFPRTFRARIDNGSLSVAAPWGVYRIRTLGGSEVIAWTGESIFLINKDLASPPFIIVP